MVTLSARLQRATLLVTIAMAHPHRAPMLSLPEYLQYPTRPQVHQFNTLAILKVNSNRPIHTYHPRHNSNALIHPHHHHHPQHSNTRRHKGNNIPGPACHRGLRKHSLKGTSTKNVGDCVYLIDFTQLQ